MKLLHLQAMAAVVVAALSPAAVVAREMITAQAIKSQCQNMVSCNRGGVEGSTCSIATQACPPCVTFDNNGCFELVGGKCNFGSDCTTAWESGTTSAASSASSGTGTGTSTATSSGSKATSGTSDSAGVASNSSSTTNSSSNTSSDSNSTSSTASSGTDMTVVFGIVGAAIGVIAVAVIFLALVRRSRASDDDDEELANTPPAMAKAMPGGPSTATHAAAYAPYAQRAPSNAPSNPTTPTNRVIKYYNDNAMPSPHGSRGGSGFNQTNQQQPQVKTVRPAAAANAPTFFKPSAPAAAPSRAVPAPPSQPYAAQEAQNYYGQPAVAAMPYAANEPLFTVHTGSEEPPQVVRRVSSPRTRRESYEF